MEAQFVCPDCRSEHAEPAAAILGHLVLCLDCATVYEIADGPFNMLLAEPPLAA